jgi:hypothetical protein
MEPLVEEARVAGNILEVIVLSLLLLGWSWFVGQRARVMRKAEELARMPRPNDPEFKGLVVPSVIREHNKDRR